MSTQNKVRAGGEEPCFCLQLHRTVNGQVSSCNSQDIHFVELRNGARPLVTMCILSKGFGYK